MESGTELCHYNDPVSTWSAGVALMWIFIAAAPLAAAPQQESSLPESNRSAIVTAITSDIQVDGLLEEREWETAPKIGELTQREPATGERPTEKTEVTLLHDANYLYIGIMCYDSEPDQILGSQMARDANLGADDRIEIVLDTYRDQRNAFYFATNPAGAQVDGLLFANGQSNMNWDAIWEVRTSSTDQGWSAEIAIPFKSLGFSSEGDGLGIQLRSTNPAKVGGRSLVRSATGNPVPPGVGSR